MTDTVNRRATMADRVVVLFAGAAGLLSVLAMVTFVLLRTTGIGTLRHTGTFSPIGIVVEALGLLAAGCVLISGGLVRDSVASTSLIFAGCGFLAAQAVLFAFGLEPTSVGLQLAAISALGAGLAQLIASDRKAVLFVIAVAALGIGLAVSAGATTLANLL